jgi:hypothetical protein
MEEQTNRVRWRGLDVYSMYPVELSGGWAEVAVESVSDELEQGIRVTSESIMRVEDWSGTGLLVWTREAVRPVRFRIDSEAPGTLRLSNCWRGPHGAVQTWLANAGMLVERLSEHVVRLRCSAGPGEVDFDDLVVRVETGSDG